MRTIIILCVVSLSTIVLAQSLEDIPPEEMVSYPTDNDLQPTQPIEIEAPMQAAPVHRVQVSEVQGPSVQQMVVVPTSEPSPRAPILVVSDMSFQAKVTPLADGAHTLDFFIYATSAGGAPLDSVLNVAVTSTDGVISTTFAPTLSIFDGSQRYLAFTIDDVDDTPLGTEPRQLMAAVPYAARVDYVGSEELDDNVDLGNASTAGSLDVFNAFSGVPGVSVFGNASQISTYGSDGLEQFRVWGGSWGEIFLYDSSVSNNLVVTLTANNDAGGRLSLYDTDSFLRSQLTAPSTGGLLQVYGPSTNLVGQLQASSSGSQLFTYDEGGTTTSWIGSSSGDGGFLNLYAGDGIARAYMDGDSAGAGFIGVRSAIGAFTTVQIDGDDGDGGARITLDGQSGQETIRLDAWAGGGGAGVSLFNSAGTNTIELDADEADDGVFRLFDAAGNTAFTLHSDSFQSAGQFSMFALDSGGVLRETVEIIASETSAGGLSSNGAQIILRNAAGSTRITLDAEFGAGGDGRITTPVLQITGGADLSEHFDVRGEFRPGMVVSIDPEHPGMLSVCTTERDRRVAGIVSGGRNIRPGLLMGQEGTRANGSTPIALSGRVWCFASTSNGTIQPGDFLTTSNTPGSCMKVRDMDLAQGAIVGKAMTRVEDGMVLVLVNLQ